MSLIRPDLRREDLIHNMTCMSFWDLFAMLGEVMDGGCRYDLEDIEAAIREKVYFPIYQNGTIVKLTFPANTPEKVKERAVQIHAEVCRSWGCDPSWSRDPKA
jgi:hypothetical protein